MLTTYVQAGEVIQVVDPVNIFEREAFQREVDQASSPRAKADIIVNRTKRTITEKMEEDPFFYRKLSKLLEQTIAEYKGRRIDEAQYLAKSIEILQAVRVGKTNEAPSVLQERDFARALFGVLKESFGASVGSAGAEERSIVRETPPGPARLGNESQEDVLASAACRIEEIVRGHAVVKWRDNEDAKNRMRNDIDDFLFGLQSEKRFKLTLAQMDAILEGALSIAQSRTVDV
jgi:type I restriction enzyme R subunit